MRRCPTQRTKSYGASRVYDRYNRRPQAISRGIAEEARATLVRPYDDPFVSRPSHRRPRDRRGHGSARSLTDIVVAPASGGGLIAGVATAVKWRYPLARSCAEPEASTITACR